MFSEISPVQSKQRDTENYSVAKVIQRTGYENIEYLYVKLKTGEYTVTRGLNKKGGVYVRNCWGFYKPKGPGITDKRILDRLWKEKIEFIQRKEEVDEQQ
jgi:hypothetical protein